MNRRALLALSGAVLTGLAGCSRTREYDAGGGTQETITEQSSLQETPGQTKTPTQRRVASVPHGDGCRHKQALATQYPTISETLTEETVRTVAKQFERAWVVDQYASDDATVTVRVTVESVTLGEDGWLVHLGGGFSEEGCSGGSEYVSDGIIAAYYFVNETTAYRADAFPSTPENPRENGTRVA